MATRKLLSRLCVETPSVLTVVTSHYLSNHGMMQSAFSRSAFAYFLSNKETRKLLEIRHCCLCWMNMSLLRIYYTYLGSILGRGLETGELAYPRWGKVSHVCPVSTRIIWAACFWTIMPLGSLYTADVTFLLLLKNFSWKENLKMHLLFFLIWNAM